LKTTNEMHKGRNFEKLRWCNIWSDARIRPSQLDRPMRLVNRVGSLVEKLFWGTQNPVLLSNLLLET